MEKFNRVWLADGKVITVTEGVRIYPEVESCLLGMCRGKILTSILVPTFPLVLNWDNMSLVNSEVEDDLPSIWVKVNLEG